MRVTVVGLGAVGLVTAACLAGEGHDVVGLEADSGRIATLRDGDIPFHEPGLHELVSETIADRRLIITDEAEAAIPSARLVIVAVGTHGPDGSWQSAAMARCLMQVVPLMADDAALVVRSTLPPDFAAGIATRVTSLRQAVGRPPVPVLLNPEFTREGTAVRDFLEPARIVVGVAHDPDGRGTVALRRLYAFAATVPVLVVPAIDACIGKLAANMFLATRISFANELAGICDSYGSDVGSVVATMAPDPRIGGHFLNAGVGFGGSCLPSQVAMMSRAVRDRGLRTPLLDAVTEVNRRQVDVLVARLESSLGNLDGARICLLGLAFKPGTDDLRDAPSLAIARRLLAEGATVVAYDPMPRARAGAVPQVPGLETAASPEAAIAGADAVALVTEWPEFREIDWEGLRMLMRRAVVVDGRNALSAERLMAAGYVYTAFGRGRTFGARTAPAQVDTVADRVEPGSAPLALAAGRAD